ncbi:hypothetical protein [Plesiomonas shigelloides]|uniref:hypothetical protein n=1 Tax=Plesiomonas shigelloides TaxID=703 RepID=UPI0012615AF8|nr:hypothetical protein [Plesiomonas shigelloides]KAB7662095.1 hypothetical protein GBN25_13135 [Plesiomonas shigelloides]
MAETSGECVRGFGCGYFIQLAKFFASLFDVFGYIHQHYEMFVGRIFCRYSAWLKREKGNKKGQLDKRGTNKQRTITKENRTGDTSTMVIQNNVAVTVVQRDDTAVAATDGTYLSI